MARTTTSRTGNDRTDLYQSITDKIIAELEAGRVPWVQPWATSKASLDMPRNGKTGDRNVRKGEHGTTVVYAHRFTPDSERRRASENGREPGSIAFLKRYTVFRRTSARVCPNGLLLHRHLFPTDLSCLKPRR